MTNILLRYPNRFGSYPKNTLISECKKIINSKIQNCDKAFIPYIHMMYQNEEKDRKLYQKIISMSRHIAIHNSIQEKEIASVINHIHSARGIHPQQAYLLIKWCNRMANCLPLEKVKMAESLWMTLTFCNFKWRLYHYNLLLKLYLNNEYDFSLVDLLEEMKCNSICPNLYTYKLCIKYYCMKGNIQKALTYIQYYKKMIQYSSTFIFYSLIQGYSKTGDIEKVNEMVDTMKEQSLQVTSSIYSHVMCTYAKSNNIDKIKEIIRDCGLNNMNFTNNNITNVIYVLAKNGHISNIDTMYQYLHKKNNISNKEMNVILKLIDINQNQIAMNILFHTLSNSNYSEIENTLKIILKYMITKSVVINDLVNVCTFLKDEEIFKKSLLILLHYSLMYNNHVSLSLLRMCKSFRKIKPHYFWPLLIKHANKYDLQGILDLLKIMINEFKISPCVNTLTDYVLPFLFGQVNNIRGVLMNLEINETVINNAYVLWKLKKLQIRGAYNYMRNFQGEYFYNIIGNDLRRASIITNNTSSFTRISYKLVDNVNSHSTSMQNMKFVSIDRQLCDFMTDYPLQKIWLRKVIRKLVLDNIRLEEKTVKLLHQF